MAETYTLHRVYKNKFSHEQNFLFVLILRFQIKIRQSAFEPDLQQNRKRN